MQGLDPKEVALRLALAFAIGVVLGFEREQHGRAAGMRTTMLVCVASALAMILSEYLFWAASSDSVAWKPDPARLAAGILAGMGFLGGGVILRQDKAIHGVTTAALLWYSSILGLAIGSGYLLLALAGFLIAFIALFILPSLESHIQSDRYAVLSIESLFGGPNQDGVVKAIEELGATIKPIGLDYDNEARRVRMHFDIKVKKGRMSEVQSKAVELVARMKGVKRTEWK